MNYTPLQIAARNLYAAAAEITDVEAIETAFENPVISKTYEDAVSLALSGPFGTVIDPEETDARETLEALRHVLEGYAPEALAFGAITEGRLDPDDRHAFNTGVDDVLSLVDEFWDEWFGEPAPEIEPEVAQKVSQIFADARISAEARSAGPEALADLLSALIGRPISFSQLNA